MVHNQQHRRRTGRPASPVSMKSEREQHITSIFHSAVAREPHERAPYLVRSSLSRKGQLLASLIASHEP